LDNIVVWFYALIVGLSGLAAFVMIVWGGVQWMTSAGNPTKTSDAKDKIQKALLGLLLVLSSFLILQVINPELTSLRITGLTPIEQRTPLTPQLPSASQGEITLSANGQEGSLRIQPGGTVTLAWNAPGFSVCQASSDPPGIWEGSKETSSSEALGLLNEEGNYTFGLACFAATNSVTKTVNVLVSSSEIIDDTVPTADLKAEGYDGPLDFPSEELRSARVEFSWTSTGADRCMGEDEFAFPGSNTSGEIPLLFIGPTNGIHRYTVTCLNLSNGNSASDTVIINVEI
ncbi:MAG: hypothetical protein Q8P55_00745, partial [bacterium]|nr:hypothetical protein [bacterium]